MTSIIVKQLDIQLVNKNVVNNIIPVEIRMIILEKL